MDLADLGVLGGVRPDGAGSTDAVEHIRQLRPVMGGRARDAETTDEALFSGDRDMRLGTERRDGDRDPGLHAAVLHRVCLSPLQWLSLFSMPAESVRTSTPRHGRA